MSANLPDVISRYFEHDNDRDIDSIVSLFTKDATVIPRRHRRPRMGLHDRRRTNTRLTIAP